MTILYEDDKIVCDEDGITIRGYYFPLGTEKRIEYRKIERLEVHSIEVHTGKYRIWGTSDPRYWLNLDWNRPSKDKALVLHIGSWVKPVITPQDPEAVLVILREKTGIQAP